MSAETGSEVSSEAQTLESDAGVSKDVIGDVVTQIGALAGEINVEELLEQQKANLKSFFRY